MFLHALSELLIPLFLPVNSLNVAATKETGIKLKNLVLQVSLHCFLFVTASFLADQMGHPVLSVTVAPFDPSAWPLPSFIIRIFTDNECFFWSSKTILKYLCFVF